jgi:hypothetical protein
MSGFEKPLLYPLSYGGLGPQGSGVASCARRGDPRPLRVRVEPVHPSSTQAPSWTFGTAPLADCQCQPHS